MADIFISYSRKDSVQALELAERLRAESMEVWIDQSGIEAATSWSGEIVRAIEASGALIVLLSKDSVESDNVVREMSLAFEKKKKILPIACGDDFTIPHEMQYQLAGIQRAQLADFEGIVRSLEKIGVARVLTRSQEERVETRSTPPDGRKSLIVLPFEDLSPSGEDNGWFADGLAGEMIDALGHIKSLRILDRKTSIGLRGAKLRTVEIGKEFHTRYFIEGSVRKFGEQIKISVSLLDIETGDYLWQESHRGEFKDIFDIQELLADKVVEGLKLHLTKEEKTLVNERGTENAEAYELYVKAIEYYGRQTKESYQFAIQLLSEAIKIDKNYADPYPLKAAALANIYRLYNRDPVLLENGIKLAMDALQMKPDLWRIYNVLSLIYLLQGKFKESEGAAKEYIRKAPDDFVSYFALGFYYQQTEQTDKAIASYEQSIKLNPVNLSLLWNLVVCCHASKAIEKRVYWAQVAIPQFERYLKLFPDDEDKRVHFAGLLSYAGREAEAAKAVKQLENITDASSLYSLACLADRLHDYRGALSLFRKAFGAGFRDMRCLREFLNDENEGVATLKGTPEYEEVRAMVEKLSEPSSEPRF